jgi:hypothetical protein
MIRQDLSEEALIDTALAERTTVPAMIVAQCKSSAYYKNTTSVPGIAVIRPPHERFPAISRSAARLRGRGGFAGEGSDLSPNDRGTAE